MGYHSNTLLFSYEVRNKASMPDQTKNVGLVTPESKFFCHAGGIINRRDQGRTLGLDISRFSTDYDSNIIGHHRNTLLPDEGSNKVYNPDLGTSFKNNLDITQCAKYLLDDPLNINHNTPSSNVECK